MSVTNILLQPSPDPVWNLLLTMNEVNPAGPVCIQVPGIRSQGQFSPENAEMAKMIAAENISVLSFDYSGCANWTRSYDPATLDTHISDTKMAIDFAGARDHILLSKSAGITMALASATERTKAIVASIPAPDLYQNLSEPYFAHKPAYVRWGFDLLMAVKGFYCWQPKSENDRPIPYIKITRDFVKSAPRNRIDEIVQRNPHRPPVHCISNEGDKLFHPQVVKSLCDLLNRAGYAASMEVKVGGKHAYTDATKETIVRTVRHYSHS